MFFTLKYYSRIVLIMITAHVFCYVFYVFISMPCIGWKKNVAACFKNFEGSLLQIHKSNFKPSHKQSNHISQMQIGADQGCQLEE